MAEAPDGEAPEPAARKQLDREAGGSITDYGAVAFLFALFFLALGMMYLISHGHP
jgi:hypothetical protein